MNGNNVTESEILLPPTFLVALIVLKCFCLICGILGNVGVILFIISAWTTTERNYKLLTLLPIWLLLTCQLAWLFYPVWIAEFVVILSEKPSNEDFFCKFSSATGFVSMFVSTLTLLAITLDRYFYISCPLKYPLMMTWPRTYGILFSTWICAFLYFPVFVIFIEPTDTRAICFCPPSVSFVAILIYVFMPTCVISYCNFKIFKLARSHVRKIRVGNTITDHSTTFTSDSSTKMSSTFSIKKEMKTVKTFLIVVGVFLFCLLPFSINVLLRDLFSVHVPLSVFVFSGDLVVVNCILNPIIYSMRQKEYRNCYRYLVGVICSRWRWIWKVETRSTIWNKKHVGCNNFWMWRNAPN
jgi:hypothetical protein